MTTIHEKQPNSSTTSHYHPQNPTYAYIYAFIDELQRSGVHHIVICPGSRSTPLAIVSASHPAIKTWLHIDERSAAFFALGLAKGTGETVALLCTSGTAAANFLPAIAEARLTHIPLLVLTADRPHELRENGAPQAIDQNHLYGTHTKWFVEVALPEASNAALRYIRTLADRASALTRALPAAPVHLNFPFREPLTPDPIPSQPLPSEEQRDPIAWYGRPDNTPFTIVDDALQASSSSSTIARVTHQATTTTRGLIVVGPLNQYHEPDFYTTLLTLAHRLGYPVLADPLSGLRSTPTPPHTDGIITSYDAFLRIDSFASQHQPELIIRFGAMPVSKPYLQYTQRYSTCPQIVIDANGGWDDPTGLASALLHTDPLAFCQDLLHNLPATTTNPADNWLPTWQQADQQTRTALQTALQDFPQLFEGRVFHELSTLLPANSALFVGNSMPIRDLDTFFWRSSHAVRIAGNRGANGIDGVVSSALGMSAANPNGPNVLVIGDLSFFHDMNGLLAAHLHRLNLLIILINNDGGGIFSFLPQANHPEHFEQLFGTPTGLDFSPAIGMYGGSFARVTNWPEFRASLEQSITSPGLHVIELRTNRDSNVSMHRQLWQRVRSALGHQED
jgi:2-succinyl-5-enolpyruvyl-6-hydroxy-3-cyclohexene-1-carboxylate synthase